jgi:hypothetical protein
MAEILPVRVIDFVGLIDAMNQRSPRAMPPGAHDAIQLAVNDETPA